MSVFGRDIDTIDNQLADSLRMAAMVGVLCQRERCPNHPLTALCFLIKVLGNVLGSTILIVSLFSPQSSRRQGKLTFRRVLSPSPFSSFQGCLLPLLPGCCRRDSRWV